MMISFKVTIDDRQMVKLGREAEDRADKLLGKLAFDLEGDIKTHFSRKSPSDPGDPPGVVTGALKNSITSQHVARGHWMVGDGVEYGYWLEYGTARMKPRPFMRPAVERIVKKLVDVFKAIVE